MTWRLIDTGPLDGPSNMALDEALLDSFDPASSSPVLRLYGWSPPALSLGKFQRAAEVLRLDRCAEAGVPVVRRITGGGVIFHADEVTYSLVCGERHLPSPRSIKESFRLLCGFLMESYRRLGLDPAFAVDGKPGNERLGVRTPFCFAGKEEYDILVGGKKLGGNAQRRLKRAIFQHGSIPLLNRAEEGAAFMTEPQPEIGRNTTSLSQCGTNISAEELQQLLTASFATVFGVELTQQEPTVNERRRAERLLEEKYRLSAWNLDGRLEGDEQCR